MNVSARSVLVVEADDFVASLLEFMLARRGLQAVRAQDGATAIQLLASAQAFDAVVLELRLPQTSGLEVLRQVRANPNTQTTPVVVLSAIDSSEAIVEAFEQGADDFVTKPFSPDVLWARLARLLAHGPHATPPHST